MTVINVSLLDPTTAGYPAVGYVEAVPTLRFNVGTTTRVPSSVTVGLVAGVCVLDLTPSGVSWCWRITEHVTGGGVRNVIVPATGPVAYTALVDVDPATLLPAPAPLPGWSAALTAETTRASAAEVLAAPKASPTFTGVVTIPAGGSITAPTGLVKADVGLSNVDNTADLAKPVSTAQTAAFVGSDSGRLQPSKNGIKYDGTDETSAFQALINAAATFGVGVIQLEGVVRCDGQITIPTVFSGTQPRQSPLRITGNVQNRPGVTFTEATVYPKSAGLDLRYAGRTDSGCTVTAGSVVVGNTAAVGGDRGLIVSGAGASYCYVLDSQPGVGWTLSKPARITGTATLVSFGGRLQSFGYGTLEIDHIQIFNAGAASSAPLLVSTATSIDLHHCLIIGHSTKSGLTCDEDILLGGPGHGTSLTAAVSSGITYTALAVRPCPVDLIGGLTQITIGEGTANVQSVTVSANVVTGATSIPVTSFVAAANHALGDSAYFNDKYVEQSLNSWNVPSGMFQGYRSRISDNSFYRFRSIRWGGFATSCHVDHNSVLHNCGSTDTAIPSTLTSALVSGSPYTALGVSALSAAVLVGDIIQIGVGVTSQETVATVSAAAGATSITVTSFTANAAYAVGATVFNPTAGMSAFVESRAVGLSVNAIVFQENRIGMSGGYNYVAHLAGSSTGSHIAGNDIQDLQASTTTLALYRCSRSAVNNLVLTGMTSGTVPTMDDWSFANHTPTQTVIDGIGSRESKFPGGLLPHHLTVLDPSVASFNWLDTSGETLLTIAGTSNQWSFKGPIYLDGAAGRAGSTSLTLGNNSTAADALVTLSPPIGSAAGVLYKYAGVNKWYVYNANGSNLYVRDMTNGVMTMGFTAGPGVTALVDFASQVRVQGNVGFYGKTPIVQPVAPPADATDLASALALVNDLKAKLKALGLTA